MRQVCGTKKQAAIRGFFTAIFMFVAGFQGSSADPNRPPPCSDPWYPYIDGIVVTGDGAGHGPDVGSDEWQSVVEFKLGVRGDSNVPARSSAAWCEFVDERAVKNDE